MPEQSASVRLFGAFTIVSRSGCEVSFATERSRQLLAMLVVQGEAPIARDRLIAALWDEGSDAQLRRCLNTELWRVRQALRKAGEDDGAWLACTADAIGFRTGGGTDVDVHRFDAYSRSAFAPSDADPLADELEAALAIYGGEFAPGVYADWCLVVRERYRGRYLTVLERLLDLRKRAGRWHDVVRLARRAIAEDPFLEHIHRDLMRGLAQLGDRAAALRHFEALAQSLKKELGVGPARETRALNEHLRAEAAPAQPPSKAAPADTPRPVGDERLIAIRRQLLALSRTLGMIARERQRPTG
jgi:DNA-binding SARP family transcriptional activator